MNELLQCVLFIASYFVLVGAIAYWQVREPSTGARWRKYLEKMALTTDDSE